MVFSSVFFIFVYLPTFLAIYYLTPYIYRSYVIIVGSYLFYAWWRVDFLALLFFSSGLNYVIGNWIHDAPDERRKKQLLALGVGANLLILFYFKYWNFFTDSLAYTFNDGKPFDWVWERVILPIGISFYNFQAISYLIDIYRGEVEPSRKFIHFCAFKALFPQLIAGPVLRYRDLAEQFYTRTHTFAKFNQGAMRFFIGLAKKVLIADSVAPIADAMFAIPHPTLAESWLGAIAYTIQLYFDFSGYSAMAIGLGMMMGFVFVENFDSPYISGSITEFWRRWHISLSSWLRDYLYIPLGGSRLGTARTYFNLFITMVLGGLWHGANWTFVFWGFWHGAILAIERFFGVKANAPFNYGKWAFTMLLVIIGWVPFRAADMTSAVQMYGGMVGLNGFALRSDYSWQITIFSLLFVAVGISVSMMEPYLKHASGLRPTSRLGEDFSVPVRLGIAAVVLAILSIIKLVADSDTPFLYFQF